MTIKVNSSIPVHQGKVFTLYRENITLPNTVNIDLDVIRHPGAVAILAMDTDNQLILIRQYRHALDGFIWEIPAGTLDPGEAHHICARREFAEETGLSAQNWQKIGEITPVPGYANERIHVFLATGLTKIDMTPEADEIISVHRKPISEVMDMVYSGKIQDAKTLSAILLSFRVSKSIARTLFTEHLI
jgi:ADP-ribose pyrophosphatase